MATNTDPLDKQIEEIFSLVVNNDKCIADHLDWGGDIIITWTGVWCENCEKPIDEILPLEDLLSDIKLEQIRQAIKALIETEKTKARVEEIGDMLFEFSGSQEELYLEKRIAELKEKI